MNSINSIETLLSFYFSQYWDDTLKQCVPKKMHAEVCQPAQNPAFEECYDQYGVLCNTTGICGCHLPTEKYDVLFLFEKKELFF